MIKTEALKYILDSGKDIYPPDDVIKALKRLNSSLELMWNNDDGQWEIYRIKEKGIISAQDLLHWQMSAPTKGTFITVGIVDWLRKYDTTQGGVLSKEDLQNRWIKQFKEIQYNERIKKERNQQELYYSWQEMINKISTVRRQISVPITVGFNKKTGKHIRVFERRPTLSERKVKQLGNS